MKQNPYTTQNKSTLGRQSLEEAEEAIMK